ncbi:MAG: hypothetical protein AB3N14_03340 [Flavobacteriaceae bacterium]
MKRFSSTIELLDQDNRAQKIYGSQVYGTFFSVFVSFKTREIDKEHIEITSATFDLVNYNGPINVGIRSIGPPEIVRERFLVLPITIQGLHPSLTQEDVTLTGREGPIVIKKSLVNYLIVQRSLCPLNYPDSSGDMEKKAMCHNVFDSEFYNRDGIGDESFNEKHRLPESSLSHIINEFEDQSGAESAPPDDAETQLMDGYRCMYSISKIVI